MILAVTTLQPVKGGFRWFLLDVPGASSIEQAHSILLEDGVLRGSMLELAFPPEPGSPRPVIKSVPCILGKGIIGIIQPNHLDIVET